MDNAMWDAAENLRRVARRLRGEAVEGLEGLDPGDPGMVAALLEHEAGHLELEAMGGKTPAALRIARRAGMEVVRVELRDPCPSDFVGLPVCDCDL